jgi:SAM-dependent methyltransferase
MPKRTKSNERTGSKIRETLLRIGAIRADRIALFAAKTRDRDPLNVHIDRASDVIFIDDYYVGDSEYVGGEYRNKPKPLMKAAGRDFEDAADSERRSRAYRQFTIAKTVCDFGCGSGSFLKLVQPTAKKVFGIELQKSFADALDASGIACLPSLDAIGEPLDLVTSFHSLEHLPDPIGTLEHMRRCLKKDGEGKVIVEVPHARDFLISTLKVQDFIDFTLWSQHLVLHTRESLRLLLADAGFKNISIEGVQRYSLANHLHWLRYKLPGGHKSILSVLQTPELVSSYEAALARLDATDTLVAVATT